MKPLPILLALTTLILPAHSAPAEKLNVLFIISDDL